MTQQQLLIPVILSGGTGSRLWPISRESHPKPFIKLPDGQSLIHKTFVRAAQLPNTAEIITITNKEYYLKSKAEYAKTTISTSYLLEPFGRNTAPAILMAALKALHTYGPEAILLVLPADHLIADIHAFNFYCDKAFALAQAGKLVTFGITPKTPETGFGYIECGKAHTDTHCYDVVQFVEKPSLEVAKEYVQSGRYLWNSGMFCFTVQTLLQEFEKHAKDLLESTQKCFQASLQLATQESVIELASDSFGHLQNISIDYALMEKSQAIAVVACDFDWQDIGSWEAYKKLHHSDHQGNTVLGDAILVDSTENFIHSEGRMVASIGINNLTIIDTPDALLISHRDRAQDVKHVVQTLKDRAHESYLTHRTVIRPWGSYTVLEEGPSFKIKRIVVAPHASLSLQLHHHRSEHWIVVEGTAKVINDGREYLLKTNESTFVPMNTAHRLSNPGDTDLIMIEVQTGHYLGEDDIVRFEDTYGRIK